METTATDISRLVSDLDGSSLPSLQQLYRLGLILFRITQQHHLNINNGRASIDSDPVVTAYRELIESISDEGLRPLFADLRKASQRLLASYSGSKNIDSKSSSDARDLALAVCSIEGLIGAFADSDSHTCNKTESNSRLCRIVYDSAWISILSALYDHFIVFEKQQQQHQQNRQGDNALTGKEIESTKKAILSCLSRLLLDGLVLVGDGNTSSGAAPVMVEESLLEAIHSIEEESTDTLRDLQKWQNRNEPFRRNLEDSLVTIGNSSSNIADEDEALERAQQREYILSMLESARGEPSSMSVPLSTREASNNNSSSQPKTTKRLMPSSSNETELDRRVKQVLQILPHFGEGFVEVALGLYKGDVEATVATLLNHPSDCPTALKVLDPKLPRRKREFQAYQTAEEEANSAEEARRDVKERMALEEKQKRDQYEALVVLTESQQQQQQQAAEAKSKATETDSDPVSEKNLTRKELRQKKLRQQRKRDEYDDDYDDQYDEVDIKLGAADDGFTSDNMTFEQVKLYNQVVQEDESDSAYWESNRNTNQKAGKTNNNSNDQKKWGPDKIKGGRVIGADGKLVRKPGGVKKKKPNSNRTSTTTNSNGNSNSNNNNNKKDQGEKPKPKSNVNSNDTNNATAANNGNKKKPKTKPRSDNRVNRQRDRKFKKQGTFGVQD